jgi:tetratricopeptide (TPR) repeat protein
MADTSTNSWKLLYEAGRQALQDRKLQEAEQSFSAALQLAEDFAAGDPRLAATLNALARIYSLQRRYLAAAALLNRLLEVTERTLGPSHVQVAGVLTNLAEMYTHLGAAREELELRERALGIRADDPNADAATLQRLRDRVSELHALLAAQTTVELDDDVIDEPLPTVRTAEYSAPMATIHEPEPTVASERIVARVVPELADAPASAPSATRDDAYRLSPATGQMSMAPWPGAAATGSAPAAARPIEPESAFTYDGEPKPIIVTPPVVQAISVESRRVSTGAAIDHGFSDMGRDELPTTVGRKIGARSSLYSIAAGVVLVAGLLSARDYVKGSDDASVSTGSVNLANATPPRSVAAPVAPAATPTETPDPQTVERLIADRRAEREARRANENRESSVRQPGQEATQNAIVDRPPRVPSAVDIERTLRTVDNAVKAIDQRTKAAADSATAIRLQAPTFKKVRMSDAPSGPVIP